MADKAKIAGEILGGMGPGLLSGIGAALEGPKKPQASPDTTTRSGAAPSGPAAKPPGFKDGGVVEKTGVAKVHKGEVVIPAPKGKGMAWKDATRHLGGKSPKGKKEVKEIRTRKGASGGFIHSHHFADPSQEPEEHVSPDQASMLQHMAANMDGGDGSAAPPQDPNAAPAQAGPPAAAPGPQVPGTM